MSSNGPYPDTIDWRTKGNYVTDVKNQVDFTSSLKMHPSPEMFHKAPVLFQGGCGSCWTFSTTGCLESVTAIAKGKLLQLVTAQSY